MATYIIFCGFTQQGIENIGESPARVDAARQVIQSMGGNVKDFYGVMGMTGCDTLFIVEAPDEGTVASAVLAIASKGNVRTTTIRAFAESEYKQIIGKVR